MNPRGIYLSLILLCCFLLIGCGNRNTRFGFGVGVHMEAPPGMKKGMGLSSWYTSSSTSSFTMTKEEFMGAALDKFIQQEHPLIAEELALGEGHRLEALVTLAMVPKREQSLWLNSIRKNCFENNIDHTKACLRQQAQEQQQKSLQKRKEAVDVS
jgi:hypothetical protein